MSYIAFRADAGVILGSGHVMRCLTLADVLRARGAKTRFLCRRQPGHLGELIISRGHDVAWLPEIVSPAEDARLSREILADHVDWLVVDNYDLDDGWERALSAVASHIMVIDDLANRPHACHVLLDQNLFPEPAVRYAGLLPADCRTLFGPAHALLRPVLSELARRRQDRGHPVKRVMVFMGGADPDNLTGRVLAALTDYPELVVDVVAGHAHPAREVLAHWCAVRPEKRHLIAAGEGFPELMAEADLAIGAGGTTTWERCCLGLPSLVIGIADNQYRVAEAVAEYGAHLYLGPAGMVSDRHLAAALETLVTLPGLRRHLAERGRSLVDGRGAERVADIMLPVPDLVLRQAEAHDADLVYRWRNDPATRRYFFDPQPLDPSRHAGWYARLLADSDRVLLIAQDGDRAVGAIRYDIEDGEADISVFLDPEARGLGFGLHLIRSGSHWLAVHRPEVRRLNARIRPENQASLAAFTAAGFVEYAHHYRLEL